MINITDLKIVGLVTALSLTVLAHAREPALTTSHQQIKEAGEAFLRTKVASLGLEDTEIRMSDIDRRLKLADCMQPLAISMNQHSQLPGTVSLLVSCQQPEKPWKIYIQANVRAFKNIIIARSTILRGEQIRARDLMLKRADITAMNGNYLTDQNQVRGMTSRQTIQQGRAIRPFQLVKSRLIKRGQEVTILAETNGISVRMRGKALNDATNGGRVRVMNSHSKRIVEGIAIRPGIVQIKM